MIVLDLRSVQNLKIKLCLCMYYVFIWIVLHSNLCFGCINWFFKDTLMLLVYITKKEVKVR
jgi:hypothetical protein